MVSPQADNNQETPENGNGNGLEPLEYRVGKGDLMNWSYYNPVALHAGVGALKQLPPYLSSLGNLLLVTSPGMVRRGSAAELIHTVEGEGALAENALCAAYASKGEEIALVDLPLAQKNIRQKNTLQDLKKRGRRWTVATIGPNPDIITLESLIQELRNKNSGDFEAIVALGGGSVMDSAKVLAVALAHQSDLSSWDIRYYFSHHHETALALPYYCVPTTSGTGAEVTPFGTIWDSEAKKKYSFSAQNLFATAAFLDPSTTLSLPPRETLYGALDSLSHSLETLWNHNSSIMGQSFARRAIAMVCGAYPKVAASLQDTASRDTTSQDTDARLCLQEASMLAGLAISQSRSALAHSMSYPLTSHFGVPHGLACSFTLPAIIDVVTQKGLWRHEDDETLAIKAKDFMLGLNLPKHVAEYCTADEVFALAGEMFAPGRVENFIVPITSDEVLALLRKSLG